MAEIRYLSTSSGRVAYELFGSGPLVVMVPGMGDLRMSYRYLVSPTVSAGFAVAVVDLRGHGDSDAHFDSYGDADTAMDLAQLLEAMGQKAVVVGNSLGAAAAAYLAATRPELVAGIVLLGPFLRDQETTPLKRLLSRIALAPAWSPTLWRSYLPKLYAGRKPIDFDAYLAAVVAALRRPGYSRAFSATTKTTHKPVEELLPQVHAPALVVMGEVDPDFSDPRAEAEWIHEQVNAEVFMVPEAGHYPQSQRPDLVAPAVLEFVEKVFSDA